MFEWPCCWEWYLTLSIYLPFNVEHMSHFSEDAIVWRARSNWSCPLFLLFRSDFKEQPRKVSCSGHQPFYSLKRWGSTSLTITTHTNGSVFVWANINKPNFRKSNCHPNNATSLLSLAKLVRNDCKGFAQLRAEPIISICRLVPRRQRVFPGIKKKCAVHEFHFSLNSSYRLK